MAVIGPTFFSSPVGDHPAGDGLTRLQTAFAGGSSADISSYAIGSGLVAGPIALSGGLLTCALTPGVETSLRWEDVALVKPVGIAVTFEYFCRFFEVAANHASAVQRMAMLRNVDSLSSGGSYSGDHVMGVNAWTGSINAISLIMASQYEWYSAFDAYEAGQVHIAYVYPAASGLNIYVNGVRVVQKTGVMNFGGGPNGTWIGGYSGSYSETVKFQGIRVRYAEMYSGASFVPPAGPEAWGPP